MTRCSRVRVHVHAQTMLHSLNLPQRCLLMAARVSRVHKRSADNRAMLACHSITDSEKCHANDQARNTFED